MSTLPALPSILTANTYFWSPNSSATSRRRSEESKLATVEGFLTSIGFVITYKGANDITATKDNVTVQFHYSESCKNVYKRLTITKAGKRSNIKTLYKYA